MKLTPLDIRKQEFSKQMRGFDVDEVRHFLEMVADEFEQVLSQQSSLSEKVQFLETKLSDYKQMEGNLQDAMMNAQKAGKEAQEESGKRANLIIQKAELDAERIIHDSCRKHQRLIDDIYRIEGQRRSFILKMKQILRGQIELLEILESESPLEDLRPRRKPPSKKRAAPEEAQKRQAPAKPQADQLDPGAEEILKDMD